MEDDIRKFKELVAKEFKVSLEDVKPNARLADDFQADSLDIIEFMVVVEEEFNIKLGNEVLQRLRTVQDACDFLLMKIQERGD